MFQDIDKAELIQKVHIEQWICIRGYYVTERALNSAKKFTKKENMSLIYNFVIKSFI